MSEYTPELGQALHGQPWKEYKVPPIWEAALKMLGEEIWRVTHNIYEEGMDPMGNSGVSFTEFPGLEVHAYSWSDDEQPYNFKWRDVEISWYKYLGRGMSANRPLDANEAADMLQECLTALRGWESERTDYPL